MAFLKGSRVTGLSPKPIDVKGFTQSASEDLEGTYSRHEVLLADAFNVTDNVTISDNLILTKLSDDGNAITVTGDASATRTISGSGSLEGSTFAQTPNASMTGMTGVIGSGVTGRGITSGTITGGTITSGVTFPAGHVLQVVTKQVPHVNHFNLTGVHPLTIMGGIHMLDITPKEASSVLYMSATIHPYGSGGASTYGYDIWDTRTGLWLSHGGSGDWGAAGIGSTTGYSSGGMAVEGVTTAGTTENRTYKVGVRHGSSNLFYEHNSGSFIMHIWEIKV